VKPTLFGLPAFVIFWSLAAVCGCILAARLARRASFPSGKTAVAVCTSAVIILVGSKLLFLAEHAMLPLEDPFPVEPDGVGALLRHGFRIPGGIFLLAVLLPLMCHGLRMPGLAFADTVAPAVGLAIFIIRIGCLLGGCCFGAATDFPLAITFPPAARVFQWQVSEGLIAPDDPHSLPVHPLEHGRTVYDEVIRVPLLMRWPGRLPAGAQLTSLVRITDVAPTMLDLLGVPIAPGRDGSTLLPVLRGEPSDARVAVAENMLFAEERVGVRTQTHTYVRWENGKEELYDLREDPAERRDLAGVEELVRPFRERYAQLAHSTAPAPAGPQPAVDRGTLEALRALGYTH
jgi:hypothetical protein